VAAPVVEGLRADPQLLGYIANSPTLTDQIESSPAELAEPLSQSVVADQPVRRIPRAARSES
jgi:hypothetical protein